MRKGIIAYWVLGLAALGMSAAHADHEEKVPFVGCPSDGQLGPQPASKGETQTITISFKLPGPIASYGGVIAPAGWHCLTLSGSAGVTTIVSAKPIPKWMPGGAFSVGTPAIDISSYSGETSGRFNVAILGHMLFPDVSKDFVKKVEDEGILSKDEIEKIAYPTDKLTYLNKTLVQFETPANTKGPGGEGYVDAGSTPLLSLVSWNDGDDGVGVSVLHINMGKQSDAWSKILMMLNTPCVTGKGCPGSDEQQ